ncbi:MAG: hypothetical protein WBA93_12910 [Microcoleaceae cyanobacterium]
MVVSNTSRGDNFQGKLNISKPQITNIFSFNLTLISVENSVENYSLTVENYAYSLNMKRKNTKALKQKILETVELRV